MMSGEVITKESLPVCDLAGNNLGIPMRFNALSPRAYEDFRRQDQLFMASERSIRIADLPQVAAAMFGADDSLPKTLKSLGVNGDVRSLDVWQLQAGQKAYIMLWRAETEVEPVFFASYLAREPAGFKLSREADADFENLSALKAARDKQLKAEHKPNFDIVRPLVLGQTAPVAAMNRNSYKFFTMPLVTDKCELSFDVEQFPGGLTCAYFRHAYYTDPAVAAINEEQVALGPGSFIREFIEMSKSMVPHLERITSLSPNTLPGLVAHIQGQGMVSQLMANLNQISPAKRFHAIREKVLTGAALIYHLSKGRMPNELMVNAGDLMAKFLPGNDVALTLMTIRGGYGKPMNERKWVELMLDHKEVIKLQGRDEGNLAQAPFCYMLEPKDLFSILSKAQKMLK